MVNSQQCYMWVNMWVNSHLSECNHSWNNSLYGMDGDQKERKNQSHVTVEGFVSFYGIYQNTLRCFVHMINVYDNIPFSLKIRVLISRI